MAESVASISTGQGEKWTFRRRRAGKAARAFHVCTHQLSQRSTPSIYSLMPLMAQLSEALSRRTNCLYKKRGLHWPSDQKVSYPYSWQQRWEGFVAQDPSLSLSLWKMLFLSVSGWVQDIPSGMTPCSSRHIFAIGELLGHTFRPITSCSSPIIDPKLGGPGYKANFAPSSITVSLCVPLILYLHHISSKALISVSEVLLSNPWL